MARESNRIYFDFFLVSLSCFSSAGWDLEINLFKVIFLNVFLERGKMGGQVGYI